MLEQIGGFIGMAAADIVHLFWRRQGVSVRTLGAELGIHPEDSEEFAKNVAAFAESCCGECIHGCWSE